MPPKLTKAQRKWLLSMGRHLDWCKGPGRKMAAHFLLHELAERRSDGLMKITPQGLRWLVSPQSR